MKKSCESCANFRIAHLDKIKDGSGWKLPVLLWEEGLDMFWIEKIYFNREDAESMTPIERKIRQRD